MYVCLHVLYVRMHAAVCMYGVSFESIASLAYAGVRLCLAGTQDVDACRPKCIIPLENVQAAGLGSKQLVLTCNVPNSAFKSVKPTPSGPEQRLRSELTLKATTLVCRTLCATGGYHCGYRVRYSVAIYGQILLFCYQSMREKAWHSCKREA